MERYLMHYGVQGQKWGVRRWQRADGTLTPEGRAHYGLTTRVLPNGDVLPVNFDASRGKDTYGVLGKKGGKFAPGYSRTYKYAKKESKRYNKLIDEQAKKDYDSIDEEYANREKNGHSDDNDAWRNEQRDIVSKNVEAGRKSVHQFLNDEWGYDQVKVYAAKEKGRKIANVALTAIAGTVVIGGGIVGTAGAVGGVIGLEKYSKKQQERQAKNERSRYKYPNYYEDEFGGYNERNAEKADAHFNTTNFADWKRKAEDDQTRWRHV